jgi:hypothetical protein
MSMPYNPFDIIDTNTTEGADIMTSEKKAEANRRNALKSTGPKTPEGKAAVRLNALKHGLRSEDILLPGEDAEALRELGDILTTELQPDGALENLLVARITSAVWRLRRLGRVEAGIFARELYAELVKRARKEARLYTMHRSGHDEFEVNMPPASAIMDEEKYQEAISEGKRMAAMRDGETATLGQTFMRDAETANAFSKLSRYETAIERSLYKALHELQRLQAARYAGGNGTPPLAIDVDVTGVSRDDS